MNRLITVALVCLSIISCTNNGYIINGSVADSHLDGKTIYKVSSVPDSKTEPAIDSTTIVNGKYTFKGVVNKPDYCNIFIPSGSRTQPPVLYATIALEKGTIDITTNGDNETIVSGTPSNDSYQAYSSEYQAISKAFKNAYDRIGKAKNDGIELTQEEMDSLNSLISDCRQKFITVKYDYVKRNINNPATWSSDLQTAIFSESTIKGKKELIAGANEYTKTLPLYKKIAENIDILEKTSVGNPFTDFTMEDSTGNTVSLSDYVGKGKYVLMDFWASWCAPCRAEMPNVIDAYNRYDRDIFEVIGISLDSDKDAWVNAIDQLKLPWPQLSDLKGWESVGSKKYGITGVPATILFDKDGVIIARNLRGEELQSKLEELLK